MPSLKVKDAVVPFTSGVASGHLRPGSVIKVIAQPTERPNRFTVNLRNAACNNNVFHFNARFDTGELVRNSNYPSSTWGAEEKSKLPFRPGQAFLLEIICLKDCYLVTIDGNYCCEFQHRVPLDKVDQIYIHGDVKLKKITIREQDNPDTRLNANNPALPIVTRLGRNLYEGDEIHLYGKVPTSGRFCVNLQQGGGYPSSNVAFHFNPRYDEGKPVVVMNSWLNSNWGKEERLDCGALRPGENFALIIRIKSYGYKVIVNGQDFAKYAHRTSPMIVDTVYITGNITVHRLVTY